MGNVSINIQEVNNTIQKLQELINFPPPLMYLYDMHCGLTIPQLGELDGNYLSLLLEFKNLVSKTISMLQRSTDAMINADRQSAKAFEIAD